VGDGTNLPQAGPRPRRMCPTFLLALTLRMDRSRSVHGVGFWRRWRMEGPERPERGLHTPCPVPIMNPCRRALVLELKPTATAALTAGLPLFHKPTPKSRFGLPPTWGSCPACGVSISRGHRQPPP